MKTIHLTENDIFNIVKKVINEQVTNKTPDQLVKRFLNGDKSVKPNIPAMKGRTFEIKDKRGFAKENFSFIVQDVEFKQTKKGASAIVKGYMKGQEESENFLTVFEFVCGSFGDFILKEYKGMDENDLKKPKKEKQTNDSESSFKNNVRQGFENFKQGAQDAGQGIKQGVQNVAQDIKQGAQDAGQGIKQRAQDAGQGIEKGFENVQGKVRQGLRDIKDKLKR